jgi:hypothetical protein
MKVPFRLHIALFLTLGVMACNRPVEEPAPVAPVPSSTETQTNPPLPVVEPGKAEPAAPVKEPTPKSTPAAAQPSKAPAQVAPAPAQVARTAAPEAAAPPLARPATQIVKIPSGTLLTVSMIDAVGTDTNKAGDTFLASIAEPVVVNGKTVLEKGMKVRGRIETLDEPGRVKGKAAMSLVLTQLIGSDKSYTISTQPFTAEAGSETKGNVAKVGGGAAIGAIVGAIAGGKKGAAVGAAVGGGAGTAAVLATKGQQLRIDSETKVQFILKNDVDVALTRSPS